MIMIDSTKTKKSSRKRGLTKMSVQRRGVLDESYSSAYSSYSAYSTYSTTSASKTKPKHTVSFAETQRIRQIPAVSAMSKREIQGVWYNDDEFEIMKQSCATVLRKIVLRTHKYDVDGLDSEWRGLEKKTREGSDARKAHRDAALLVVLNEQKKQRKHPEIADPSRIAKVYQKQSAHCKTIALRVAAHDAKLIHGTEYPTKVPALKPSELLPEPLVRPSAATSPAPTAAPAAPAAPEPASPQETSMSQAPPSSPKDFRPTLAWNASPHDETLSHKRILSMMNAKKLLSGSQRQMALAA